MRLFVALTPPPPVRAALAERAVDIPRARWVAADRMHLTLRFLGEVAPKGRDDLEEALGWVQAAPFEVGFAGVGSFGRPPRVLWAGVEPPDPVVELATQVDQASLAAGLPPADKPFRPHLTLARLKTPPPHRVRAWLEHNRGLRLAPFRVERFDLVESRPTEAGSAYTVLRSFPLGRGEG